MAIFKLILSLLVFPVIILYYIYKHKHGEDYIKNLVYKKSGIKCYNCSSEIKTDIHELIILIGNAINSEGEMKLCKSCHRDYQLSELGISSKISFNVKKFAILQSPKWNLVVLITCLLIIILTIFVKNQFLCDVLSIFNSLYLIIYWIFEIYKLHIIRK